MEKTRQNKGTSQQLAGRGKRAKFLHSSKLMAGEKKQGKTKDNPLTDGQQSV